MKTKIWPYFTLEREWRKNLLNREKGGGRNRGVGEQMADTPGGSERERK